MKSWQLEKKGRENLHLVETSKPAPGPNQILVRTTAVSLNCRDKAIIEGSYPVPVSFQLVPGSDLAGEVVSAGRADRAVERLQPFFRSSNSPVRESGARSSNAQP